MKWSWKLARIAGIDVYVHATFLLLVGWVAMNYWFGSRSLNAALEGTVFVLALFGFVLMHEYGHALTARRFGVATRHITLLPIGGVAALERIPEEPRRELWIAAAGPAVNLAAAVLLAAGDMFLRPFGATGPGAIHEGSMLGRLAAANLILAVFNLVPAFPMDGGRILRALLALSLPYARATRYAASTGRAIALVFGFAGLMFNPFLVLIALFVWMGAGQEASAVELRHALRGVPARLAVSNEFRTLDGDDSIGRAAEILLAGRQHDFPVVEYGRVTGILTGDAVIEALQRRKENLRVRDVMKRDFITVRPSETLELILERFQDAGAVPVAVAEDGSFLGLLTPKRLAEFLSIRRALEGTTGRISYASGNG